MTRRWAPLRSVAARRVAPGKIPLEGAPRKTDPPTERRGRRTDSQTGAGSSPTPGEIAQNGGTRYRNRIRVSRSGIRSLDGNDGNHSNDRSDGRGTAQPDG